MTVNGNALAIRRNCGASVEAWCSCDFNDLAASIHPSELKLGVPCPHSICEASIIRDGKPGGAGIIKRYLLGNRKCLTCDCQPFKIEWLREQRTLTHE